MKKMKMLGLASLFVLGFTGFAQAAEIKATGAFQIDSYWNNSMNFTTLDKDKSFHIEQRIRTAFQFIANENLKGVLETQIGSNSWGNGLYQISAGRTPNDTATGSNSAGNGNIMLRKGYIDFKWPDTKVNFLVGFQTVALPAAFGGGSAILDDQVGAAVVSTPITDNVKLLAGYARPYDANNFGSTANVAGNGTQGDVAFAAVPVDFSGFNITPFAAYMYAGRQAAGTNAGPATTIGFNSFGANASVGARGYWGGVAFTMTALEPFKVMADFNYGKVTYSNYTLPDSTDGGRQGWLFDLAVDYTGLSMMTPEVYFVYTSGNGKNDDKDGRMPVMGNPQSWTINNSFFFSDRNLISGNNTNANGGSNGGGTRNSMGFWATGFALKDIKLFDNFSHTVNVMYVKGTNDHDAIARSVNRNYGVMLTDKDSLFEIDLQNKYKIYQGLDLILDLGYINADIDKDTWRQVNANYGNDDMLTKNAYRVALGLKYTF
ncbi:hypothetical protein SAMN04488503_1269 [Humidesulfovibrio mexicanus]|uniref:Outer membrane protein (Porin) n=1 Tax=Humidesulfovibrio mexicanus TaxID=147047 RepID=A0A238Z706_9BACT|nr:outer membrane homotrimeric porin [Humidesulfovibrio mexicanus]SNR78613.1 hypothetical protein SAMN04488503_1269 [Humidesulfovibrio mexicanus]